MAYKDKQLHTWIGIYGLVQEQLETEMPIPSQCKGGSAQHVEAWKKKLHQGLLDLAAVELLKDPSQNHPQLEMLDCKWSLEMVGPQTQLHYQYFLAQNPARNSKRNLQI